MKGAVACFALKGLKSLEHNWKAQPTQITLLKSNDITRVHIY
jgi:hypothetical protein